METRLCTKEKKARKYTGVLIPCMHDMNKSVKISHLLMQWLKIKNEILKLSKCLLSNANLSKILTDLSRAFCPFFKLFLIFAYV